MHLSGSQQETESTSDGETEEALIKALFIRSHVGLMETKKVCLAWISRSHLLLEPINRQGKRVVIRIQRRVGNTC